MHSLTHDQLSHKGAAQGGAECPVQLPAVVPLNIPLDLLRHRDHIREDGVAPVKAVVVDADQVILLSKPVQHRSEVCLIIAGCPRKEHQCFPAQVALLIKLHSMPPPSSAAPSDSGPLLSLLQSEIMSYTPAA